MISSRTFEADASISGWANNLHELANPALMAIYGNDKHPTRQQSWSAGLNYRDSPTITYSPVQGEKFADRMMTSIPETTIFQLCQSGWSIDQLLECCVQMINGVSNSSVGQAGVSNGVRDPRFARVAALLKEIQDAGLLVFAIQAGATGGKEVVLHSTPDLIGM
jgi:hypothetical protein